MKFSASFKDNLFFSPTTVMLTLKTLGGGGGMVVQFDLPLPGAPGKATLKKPSIVMDYVKPWTQDVS